MANRGYKRAVILGASGIVVLLLAWECPHRPVVPPPKLSLHTVRLSEWGVQFQTPLSDLQYVMDGDTIGFTAASLANIDPQCAKAAVPFEYPLGALQRSHSPLHVPNERSPDSVAHFGEYYYYFTPPQAHCFLSPGSDTTAHEQFLAQMLESIPNALRSLAPAS